jgi:hypothetical protein
MRITDPVIKHGLSEIMNGAKAEARTELQAQLIAAFRAYGQPIITKKRALALITDVTTALQRPRRRPPNPPAEP